MKYATVFRTVTCKEEVDFSIDQDFPQNFHEWTNDAKFDWLDENAVQQDIVSEEYLSVDSIDTVYFDE